MVVHVVVVAAVAAAAAAVAAAAAAAAAVQAREQKSEGKPFSDTQFARLVYNGKVCAASRY